ncbi:MAG: hypothetical protein IJE68_00335 [Clostridia bacterium]|nr:hypothetical protein [Clostridia bacterium]
MKNHKKFLLLLIGICICVLLFFIVQIYAKYITSTEGNTSLTIANWNILVNNMSIMTDSDISNSIVPVFPGTDHIASGIIAPTAEGYFDLNLDFSNVDVSFQYDISVSADENSCVQDLVAIGYALDDGEKIIFENYNTPISEIIELSSELDTRKVRVYIKWNDDESSQTMANDADTLSTSSESQPLLHVNVSFTQITETLS